jgi:Ca2+/Na+ antiporter
MFSRENGLHKLFFLLGTFLFLLFCAKEIGNFYQSGHAGFTNAEVGLSHLNTVNNGFLKTKLGATNYKVIIDRAPTSDEYYTRYPYLHNLLIAGLWAMTGPSEILTRLFIIMLVILALMSFYLVFRNLGYNRSQSTLIYLTLCSFPVFFHYSSFSNGEISCLLPLALSLLFYLKWINIRLSRYLFFFLICLSVCCQLFWYGYIAALFFFADALFAFFSRREKKSFTTAAALVLTVVINLTIYIIHTLWLVGSLNNAFKAFLWRSGLQAPAHQKFTLLEFINKNLTRWWLFNPMVIFLAILGLIALLKLRDADAFSRIRKRTALLLLLMPLFFSFFLAHLIYWHDFLIIYFAFFLAMVAVDFLAFKTERMMERQKKRSLTAYSLFLLVFAVFGLFQQPEQKKIDYDTDNYELYYTLKALHNLTSDQDRFLFVIDRIQEPQVRFYLRRVSVFLKYERHAPAYIDTGEYAYCLVEGKPVFGSLVKHLLSRYRAQKYGRYFVFNLKRPDPSLRIFRREKKKTGLLFKYFVSPYHQPGSFTDITSQRRVDNVHAQFENFLNLLE